MNSNNPTLMQIALAMLPKLNSFTSLPLFSRCGGIESFFMENATALAKLYQEFNIRAEQIDREKALKSAEEELALMDKHNIHICTFEDHLFPPLLQQCEDAPLVFFYKGTLETDKNATYLAIVGTRRASSRCQAKVESILEEISGMGHSPVIVSGLAFGIDASAHRGSLKCNLRTYAVLGHGLHMIYPAAHKNLAEKILAADGALISEFPCNATVHSTNFLQRNRIVAGLSQATLIAESAEKGGAMATARMALSYARDVMAIPGRPEDIWSVGCNRLIKENVAALVENGTDIANILGLSCQKQKPIQTSLNLFEDGNGYETTILQTLTDKGELNIDELKLHTRIPISELSATLLKLELEGRVTVLPGKNYGVN